MNYISSATLKLKEAKQKERQSIREFANLLKEIKEDIFKMLYKESRAWSLLNGLRTEIRNKVLREKRKIRSREQIVTAV
jgi:hypothetical protein